jgi:RES domain-containing protein
MRITIFLTSLLFLFSCHVQATEGYRSKISDLGRVIYENDEATLLTKVQGFESQTQVAVKVYTTFRLHENFDVKVVFTTELNGDNTIVIVVQANFIMSAATGDFEPGRYKDALHVDRTENLNREHLLPDYIVEAIRKRMIDKFNSSLSSEGSKKLYYSLDHGVEVLSSLIYNPVAVKGSLIWESLWNRPDPYISPEIAGFIDGSYNTCKGIMGAGDAIQEATTLARDFAFNYSLNIDGYRDAVNELVTETVTDLDTYITLANEIVAAEDKLVNIYKGTTPEDRYWRGIIAFEVAGIIFPLTKTKAAAKTASGIRSLLDDLKRFKLSKLTGSFIAKTGTELEQHLATLVTRPAGIPYKGAMYRSIDKKYNNPLEIGQHVVDANYRYTKPGEGGLYLSKSLVGNVTEVSHYKPISNYKTYHYGNVEANNLLDLTNPAIRKQLGVDFDLITRTSSDLDEAYEFTHKIGLWARGKYDGIIVPGARGAKDYVNIVLFEQATVDKALLHITPNIVTY